MSTHTAPAVRNARSRITQEQRQQMQTESLMRASLGQSGMNYNAIYEGFMAKGIPEHEILPRENVFTFHAWKALGRSVRKGEHGVKVLTWIARQEQAESESESVKVIRMPRCAVVFHISQTDPIKEKVAVAESA